MRGESSLRGHLKADGEEQVGSQSYVPPEAKDDGALNFKLDLMRGVRRTRPSRPKRRPQIYRTELRLCGSLLTALRARCLQTPI